MTIDPKHEPILQSVASRHPGATFITVQQIYRAAHQVLNGEKHVQCEHRALIEHEVDIAADEKKKAKTAIAVAKDGLFAQVTQIEGRDDTQLVMGCRYAQETLNAGMGLTAIRQWG